MGVAATPTRGRLLAAWALVFALAVLLAACGSNGSDGSPGSPDETVGTVGVPTGVPTTASPSPTSAADTARQQAIAAYLGMWQDMAAAATTSDWQSPQLAQHATGAALQVISGSLYTDHRNGFVTKGAPENNPTVSSADPPDDPTTVLISDCGDSTNWLKYRADNGQPVGGEPGGRRSITAEVKKQPDGVWRVTRFAVQAVGTC